MRSIYYYLFAFVFVCQIMNSQVKQQPKEEIGMKPNSLSRTEIKPAFNIATNDKIPSNKYQSHQFNVTSEKKLKTITKKDGIDFRIIEGAGTHIYDINDAGFAINPGGYYNYYTEEATSIESEGKSMYRLNNNGDVAGDMVYSEYLSQPGYKKNGTWKGIGFFEGDTPDDSGWFASGNAISENSKYVTGQISVNFMSSYPFLYNTETNELKKLAHPEYDNGRGQGVNSDGIVAGWVDRDDLVDWGTFRVPVYYTTDGAIHYIDFDTQEGGEAWDVNNSGQVVGQKGGNPFIYNINTGVYQSFTPPQGSIGATFLSISENGFAVGYSGDLGEREVIIYHPSLGSGVLLLKDLLIAKGIEVNTFDGRLGTAMGISPNGNFISGFDNTGPIIFASGWIINLNDQLLLGNDCIINCPENVVIPPLLGSVGIVVNYDLPINCNESSSEGLSVILVKGLPSGSEFPIGVTEVTHHLVDAQGNVEYICSFTVTVEDAYCENAPLYSVVPITDVKFAGISNLSSAESTYGHEYFLNALGEVSIGSTHELTVTAATTFELGYIVGAYIDWNQDGDFTDSGEFYDLGEIMSIGTEPGKATANISIPENATVGAVRMRVIMKYDWNTPMAPIDPCDSTNFYVGQIEDYTINVSPALSVSDINDVKTSYYPNPVKDLLNISCERAIKNISIYDLSGKNVKDQKINGKDAKVDISSLNSGIYVVAITDLNNQIKSFKIVKQ